MHDGVGIAENQLLQFVANGRVIHEVVRTLPSPPPSPPLHLRTFSGVEVTQQQWDIASSSLPWQQRSIFVG